MESDEEHAVQMPDTSAAVRLVCRRLANTIKAVDVVVRQMIFRMAAVAAAFGLGATGGMARASASSGSVAQVSVRSGGVARVSVPSWGADQVSGASGHAVRASLPSVGPWHATGDYLVASPIADEGLATVEQPGGGTTTWYSGIATIPIRNALRGWTHVGDIDSFHGYVAEPYQWGRADPTSKMYEMWTPGPHRRTVDFFHKLAGDEEFNNSFSALTPDGQWMVSGEWDTMSRLLVFPTPMVNRAATDPSADLRLRGYIRLDHPVNDVQGCSFVTETRLVCASDESSGALFGVVKPLLQVDLATPLTGRGDVKGHVTALGPIPLRSLCHAAPSGYEVEGTDYDRTTGVLRVEVIQPGVCAVATTVWRLRLS
jgi:hypothetical protein